MVGDPDERTYTGPEAMGRAWAEWLSVFDDFGVHPEGRGRGDRILVMTSFSGRGNVRPFLYADRDEARRAVQQG